VATAFLVANFTLTLWIPGQFKGCPITLVAGLHLISINNMTCDEHAVRIKRPMMATRRQEVITELTTSPPGWVWACKCQCTIALKSESLRLFPESCTANKH